MGIREGIKEIHEEKREEEEGLMERVISIDDKKWKILTIYARDIKIIKKKNRRKNERRCNRKYINSRGFQWKIG